MIARDAISDQVARVSAEMRPKAILRDQHSRGVTYFAVYDGDAFVGVVTAQDALASPDRIFADLIPNERPLPAHEDTPLTEILPRLENNLDAIPVLDANNQFIGLVTRESLSHALLALEQTIRLQNEQHARRLELLNEFASFVNRETELGPLVSRAQRFAAELLHLRTAWVILLEQVTNEFSVAADYNLAPELAANDKSAMRWTPCRCQQMLLSGELTQAVNIVECERFERVGIANFHASVPLKSGERVLGLLNVVKPTGEALETEELQILSAMGAQLGVAIERARLLEQTRARRIEEQAALSQLSRALSVLLDTNAILDSTAQAVQQIFHPDLVSLMLPDEQKKNLVLRAGRGWENELYGSYALDIATSREGYAFANGKAIWLEDVQNSARFPCPAGLRERGIHSSLTAPLKTEAGVLGTLCAHFRAPRKFSDDDTQLLSLIASQTALAFERARLFAESRIAAQQFGLLYDAGLALNSVLDPRVQLEYLLQIALKTVHAERAGFFRYDVARRVLIYESGAGHHEAKHYAMHHEEFALGEERGLIGYVAAMGAPLYVPDSEKEFRLIHRDPAIRSEFYIPVKREDRLMGVFAILSTRLDAFSPADQRLLVLFANQFAVALENARLLEAMRKSEEELRRRADEFAALYETARELEAEQDLTSLLQAVLERAVALVAGGGGGIELFDPIHAELELIVLKGASAPLGTRLKLGEGMAGRVAEMRQPMILDDYSAWQYRARHYAGFPIRAIVQVPMLFAGELIGVLGVNEIGNSTRKFTESDGRLLSLFAGQAAALVRNARLLDATQQAEQQQRVILNNIDEVIYMFNISPGKPEADTVQFVSGRAEDIIGYSPDAFIADPNLWFSLIHPEDASVVQAQTQAIYKSRESGTREYRLQHKVSGEYRWIEDRMTPKVDHAGNLVGIFGVARDITERKRVERALQETELQLRAILSNAPITIFATDSHGVFTLSEGKGLEHVGLKPGENVGVSALDLFGSLSFVEHTGAVTTGKDIVRRVLAGETVSAISELRSAYFDNHIGPLRDKDSNVIGIVGVATDITERKRAEQERVQLIEQLSAGRERLRDLSRQLLEVQEDERRHIARELHDEIGQTLTNLKISLEMAERVPCEGALSHLSVANELVNQLLGRVHELSLNLRPSLLDDLGLLDTLLWHNEHYAAQTRIQVIFKQSGIEGRRFASEMETAAFRVVQEALTNVARHARVNAVTVRVWADDETLWAQVEDQGIGFDPSAVRSASAAMGLSGMRERVTLLGGRLTLDSKPGGGTALTAELPLRGWVEKRKDERFDSAGG